MKKVMIILFAALLAGCASPAPSPESLNAMDAEKSASITEIIELPVQAAYRNFLFRARQCWQVMPRVVESDPFDSDLGFARVSVRVTGGILMDSFITTTVDFSPINESSTKLVGKSLLNPIAKMPGHSDFPNFKLWAEGKDAACL